MPKSAYLTKIGTALPDHSYDQLELADWMADRISADKALKRKLKVLYKMTRIEQRHSVLPDFTMNAKNSKLFKDRNLEPKVEQRMKVYHESVLNLSIKSIEDTIEDEDDLKEITHLITVSCTGLSAPGVELRLKEELPFRDDLQVHAVNFVGCYAFFPALKMAEAFCQADPSARVLIVATEICTIHFQNSESEDHILSNALFADGSAACLIAGEKAAFLKNGLALKLENTAQMHFPQGKQDMAWEVHSSGFLMKLTSYVPDLLNAGIGQLVERLKDQIKYDGDIQNWAIHPGGRRILEVCADELKLNANQLDASYKTLRQVGNLSAPTILFVIKELWSEAKADQHLFACGFGPGLTLEGALFKWIDHA